MFNKPKHLVLFMNSPSVLRRCVLKVQVAHPEIQSPSGDSTHKLKHGASVS